MLRWVAQCIIFKFLCNVGKKVTDNHTAFSYSFRKVPVMFDSLIHVVCNVLFVLEVCVFALSQYIGANLFYISRC